MVFKNVKSSFVLKDGILEIKNEFGYTIYYDIGVVTTVDTYTKYDDGKPDFQASVNLVFKNMKQGKKSMTLSQINKKLKNISILNDKIDYDHIQIGFVYADSNDPNNHKWMLNFMDVNNRYIFGYNTNKIKINCPFTTISWEDGNWHGRFIVYKKDVEELLEPKQDQLVINGNGDIGDHKITPIQNNVDYISLRYNIYTNMWYCDLLNKNKKIGEYPCKAIICDVPFEGHVDKSSSKPKVTAKIKASNIKGISMALNALIIKRK